MLYAQAKLPRFGLANQLFVWARAVKFCMEYDAKLLAPAFVKFKVGPILRRERDWRFYAGLFQPNPAHEIAGLKRLCVLALTPKISEESFKQDPAAALRTSQLVVIQRQTVNAPWRDGYNFSENFSDINVWHATISAYLTRIVRPRWIEAAKTARPIRVAVHVRLGDLTGPQRHPLDWYVEAITFVRSIAGEVPVAVFSDGSDAELAPILRLANVRLVRTGSAISDLLALSTCEFLIATGSSSFSAWAAYLGQMPACTRLGNSFSWFDLHNAKGNFIGEWDPSRPDPHLIRAIESLA